MKLNYFKTLFVAILVIFATTAKAETYSGTCGDNLNWSLDTEIGLLKITGTGRMTSYSFDDLSPWYSYISSIKSVEIDNGVTSIGSMAFYGCSGLTSINIPNSVTSIGNYAFNGCSKLANLRFEDGEQTLSLGYGSIGLDQNVGRGLFYDCPLETLYLGRNLSLSYYTIRNYGYSPFYNKTSLTSVTIGDSVTSIQNNTFKDCSGLTSITIPNSVTSIGSNAFNGCSGLTSVTIGNSVTSIGNYAFSGCSGLTNIMLLSSVPPYIFEHTFFNNDKTIHLYIPVGAKSAYQQAEYWSNFSNIQEVSSGSCGDSVNWNLNTETGLLKITGTGAMENYTRNDEAPWYSKNSYIKSIEIGEGITSIGDYAFDRCSGLTSITIPNSVTKIGFAAFAWCSGLTSVTIGNGVTTIGGWAFELCSKLTSISISNSVTSIGYSAFYGCSSLTSITIPNSVTSIGSFAFDACTKLSDLRFEDGEKTLSLGYNGAGEGLFYACPLKTLYLGRNLSYSTSQSDGYSPFYDNTSLTSVTIGDSVTTIKTNAFGYCSGLKGVYITDLAAWCNIEFGNYSANPLFYAEKLYLNNELVTDLVIPEGVETIKNYAYNGCTGLTSITIPNSVTFIGNSAFNGCTGLTSIDVDSDNANYSLIDGVLFNKDKSQLILFPKGKKGEFVIPNSITSIGSEFSDCTGLTSITIPNSVTSIGSYAFYKCSGLKSVKIGNSVTSIGNYAFEYCSGLTGVYITDLKTWCNIEFGNIYANPLYYAKRLYLNNKLVTDLVIPEGVETIKNYAFDYCTGLTSITIPNSVTSIAGFDFYNYKGLSRIDVASDNANYSSIDGVLFNKDKTQIIIFPKGKKGEFVIPNSITSIGSKFSGCSGLTSITIPNSVTSIGSSAFYGCSGLTSITIPNSVTSIGSNAFDDCTGLTDLRFEDGEKTLSLGYNFHNNTDKLGEGLFYDCPLKTLYLGRNLSFYTSKSYGYSPFYDKTTLTSVTIGDSVTSIQNNTFKGCTGLKGVYITDLKAWCNIEFGNIYANPLYHANKLYLNNELVTNLNIPKEVTELKDYTFYDYPLNSVTIPNSVTSIGDSTFYYSTSKIFTLCTTPPTLGTNTFYISSSASVHLFGDASDVNVYKSTSGWSKFKNYVTHELPLDFTAINEEKTITYRLTSKEEANNQHVSVIKGEEAYRGNINIPDTVNYMDIDFTVNAIGDAAFSESNIIEIGLPQTLEKIGDEAFYGCSRLRNMTYPESLKSIGVSAFEDCVKMTEVVLCENVEKIEAYAFAGCTGLTNVYSLNPVPPVCDVDAFYGIGVEVQPMTLNKAVTNVSLYVPEGSVSAYQAAPEWCNFYNIVASDFVGIEDFEIDTNSDKPNAYISGGVLMLTGIDMPTNVAVYNLSGTNVANVMVTPDNCSIDLSNLPKGIYIVAIKGNVHKVIL